MPGGPRGFPDRRRITPRAACSVLGRVELRSQSLPVMRRQVAAEVSANVGHRLTRRRVPPLQELDALARSRSNNSVWKVARPYFTKHVTAGCAGQVTCDRDLDWR